MKISLIKDYDQSIPTDVLLVESDSDYVKACYGLAEKTLTNVASIWVRKTNHYKWLQDYVDQIRIDISFDQKTPRLILCERWNVLLPEWLDDETVTSQKLLSLNFKFKHKISFETAMLESFLGKVFHAGRFKIEDLSEIISALTIPESLNIFKTYPILLQCFKEKLNSWKSNSSEYIEKVLIGRLAEDAEVLWRELTLLSILSNYPKKLLEYVIPPDRLNPLLQIPTEALANLRLQPVALDQALSQIEWFFNDISEKIDSSGALSKLLNSVSGRLTKEFKLVTYILDCNQFETSWDDVNLIQRKFSSCLGISAVKLSGLKRYVKPQRPAIITKDESWDCAKWCNWSVNSYIPYRKWQIQNRFYDSEVESTVQRFSDWYLEEYPSIHSDSEISLVHALTHWRELIKNDVISLILLIDCLPCTYWDIFQEAMAKSGFHRHELKHAFTPLPSDTAHSKAHLLSGNWNHDFTDYELILKERSKSDWGNKEVFYLPNLKALSDLEAPDNPAVVLLNFLPPDEILHSDVELKDSTYEEEMYRLFTRVSDSAKNLFEKTVLNGILE